MKSRNNGNKSLVSNAIFSSLRTLTTIIFPLITYPYITRVLLVDNMGRINFAQSIVNYFTLLAGLGISSFAVREGAKIRDDKSKLNYFANQIFTINVISTLLSLLLLVVLVFLPTKLALYREMILILGITIALSPFALEWLYTLEEDFIYITLRGFFIQLLALILMFAFVKDEKDVYIYVAITTFATSLGNLFNFVHARKYVHLHLVKDTNWINYKKTIITFFVNSIASTIYLNSDATLLSLISGDYANGLYSAATKIYFLIKQLFNAITGAIIPRLSYLVNNDRDNFRLLLNRLFLLTSFFMIPAVYGIILLKDEIILIISGKMFLEATNALSILAVALVFAVFANIFVNGLLICVGREKFVLRATIVSALINILLNVVCIPWLKQDGAALTTLIAEAVVCAMAVYYARDYLIGIVEYGEIFKAIFGSTIMFLIVIYVRNEFIYMFPIVVRIILTIIISVISYILIMYIIRDKALKWIISNLLKVKLKG